jgi:arginyl-tRNA synthetase
MISRKIDQLINQALDTLNLPHVSYTVEHPSNQDFGDYATNVPLILFKQLKQQGDTQYQSPLNLAQTIAATIKDEDSNFSSISAAPPGFINFTISNQGQIKSFNNFFTQSELIEKVNTGKTVIVEYSSPNIAKPFTIGHLRSTIIGDAIANIKAATGWKVLRDNHLGDWGTQFGKLICAIKKNWIPFEQIETSENPIKLLVELYVRFHEEAEKDKSLDDEARAWFKQLEDGNPEARQLWQKCINWSWKEFDRIYHQLNVTFSPEFNQGRGLGESYFEDKMNPIIDQLNSKRLLKTGELGAKVVEFGDQYPPLMILKKDGATLYATRDLATDYYRKTTYHPDCIINEVGAEQSLYFKQLFEIEYQLGWYQPGQRIHVGHGMYRFKDSKMSTRKGNVIWLDEVIQKAIAKSRQFTENIDLAKQIAIGALKWNDLKGEAKRDIVFDWNEILSMKGNSGPYIQYTYARANSVIVKSDAKNHNLDPSIIFNDEERSLIRLLLRFSDVVNSADTRNDPSQLCTYLYDLCQRFNAFYNKHTILGNPVTAPGRLAITTQTKKVIGQGLTLLGIAAPEKM